VIECLKLKDSSVVADLGYGVGYFSLKLAPKVAKLGSVLAEDILGGSLTFLWIRALFHRRNNIRIIHGNPDDPLLLAGGVDSVLIANSYRCFDSRGRDPAAGFDIVSRDDHFIDRSAAERPGDRPDDHVWWLIVARKP
jgi:hypothetical protein